MNLNALMQQAQKMQSDLEKSQKELEAKVFELSSAGGAIKIKIKGDKQIESIDIDKDAIDPDDKEGLEDMIKIAVNEAINVVKQAEADMLAKKQAGLRLPF